MTKEVHAHGEDASQFEEGGGGRRLLQAADLVRDSEELREQLRQERERHLRTLADFTNYRRRIEREGNKLAESGKREVILPLLDIVDDLERSLQWAGAEGQPFSDGVRLSYRKLLALLKAQGVCPFESVGKLFTPELHDAVAVSRDARVKPGTILQELRRGYLWKNELLRPAQVRVAERAPRA
jgi:molecular chaperone GrpE